MGVVYNQREVNYETYGFPGLVYDFARAGNLRDGISKRNDYISIGRTTTGTYVGSDGLIKTAAAFEPRFEYDSSGNPLGLLIEEQRTNLSTYSENFSVSPWSLFAASLGASSVLSPSGTSNVTKVIPNSGATNARLQYTNSTAGTYMFTIYAKADGFNFLGGQIQTSSGGFPKFCFDLTTGQFGVQDGGGIVGYSIPLFNSWWRLHFYTPIHNGAAVIKLAPRHNFDRTNLDGVVGADGIKGVLFWGAQLETGTFPTSYIPTSGSTVTRGTDNFTISSPNFYNSSSSSIILHYVPKSTTGTQPLLSFDDNTTNNEVKVSIATTTPTLNVVNAGVTTVAIGTAPNVSTTNLEYRVSLSAKDNQFSLASEGIGVVTTTSGSLPVGITTMRIGHDRSGNRFSGHIKKLIYYPRELTTPALRVFSTVQDGYSQIVNDGLVLHLDAGNRKSYSGSGTTWTDLSGRGNNGTLENGVGYNSGNGGSLVFDGSNDYASISNFSYRFNTPFTLSIWTNFISVPLLSKTLISNYNDANNDGVFLEATAGNQLRFSYRNNGIIVFDLIASPILTNNTIYNIVATYDATTAICYINNGQISPTAPATSLFTTTKTTLEINRISSILNRYVNSNTYSVQIYNKALTASEIQQNFNALRGRFGI
jgi:hypothetical protein